VLATIGRVRLFPLYHFNQLTYDLNYFLARVWVITIARGELKIKVIGQGHCKNCERYTNMYCGILSAD